MTMRHSSDDDVTWRPAEAADSPMTMSVDRDGDALILVVSGEVDMATVPRLTAELVRCLAKRPALLLIDLSAVTFFGSAGLHPLAAVERQARKGTEDQITVRIVASRVVLWVLELTGLMSVLAVYPTRGDALAGTNRTDPDGHAD